MFSLHLRVAFACAASLLVCGGTAQTPVHNTLTSGTQTTGSINPGVIWVGKNFQIGVEAIIPINRASGDGVGIMGQLHFYLDDIFPTTLGRPLLASSINAGRASLGR